MYINISITRREKSCINNFKKLDNNNIDNNNSTININKLEMKHKSIHI